MVARNCGAPARYWRFGLIHKSRQIVVGTFSVAELWASDTPDFQATNILSTATLTVDHAVGLYEVTAPLDATSNPILDGAVLVDGDPATSVTVSVKVNPQPRAWFVDADFGAATQVGIESVGINVASIPGGSLSDYRVQVWSSDDGVNWRLIDEYPLFGATLGSLAQWRNYGRSTYLRNTQVPLTGGDGFIPGIVSEDSAVKPNARVFCFERDTMRLVAEGRADINGNYVFYGLDPNKPYLLMAVDDDGAPMKQPVAWDHVYPTRGPYSGTFAIPEVGNRLVISDLNLTAYYRPGLSPDTSISFGLADFHPATPWSENPFPSGGYFLFRDPAQRAVSTIAPLRPDRPLIHLNVDGDTTSTQSRNLNLVGTMARVAESGFSVEFVLARDASLAHDVWISVLGYPDDFDNLSWGERWLNAASKVGWRGYGSNNISTQETAHIAITQAGGVRVVAKGSLSAMVDQTITPTINIVDGNPHHYVIVLEPGVAISVYVDGTLAGTISMLGSGSLETMKWQYTSGFNHVQPAVLGQINVSTQLNPVSSYFWWVTPCDLGFIACYKAALTATQCADLYNEVLGNLADKTSLLLSGYEASVLFRVPAFYMPMQDASTDFNSTDTPPRCYPAPGLTLTRTVSDNADAYLTDGSLVPQTSIPGSTRSTFKLISSTTAKTLTFGYGGVPAVESPRQRTFAAWVRTDAYPTTGVGAISIRRTQLRQAAYSIDYGVATYVACFQIGASGAVSVVVSLAAYPASEFTWNTSYTLPLNTLVFLTWRYDFDRGVMELFANGALVDTLTTSLFLWFGSTGLIRLEAPANSGPWYFRDLMVFDRALTDTEISDLYNAGL